MIFQNLDDRVRILDYEFPNQSVAHRMCLQRGGRSRLQGYAHLPEPRKGGGFGLVLDRHIHEEIVVESFREGSLSRRTENGEISGDSATADKELEFWLHHFFPVQYFFAITMVSF